MRTTLRQRGFTLIELIVFIVIVSVALVGVLTVLNITTQSSADPMIRKQMLAIAEALLEEVQMQPFTWCDPTDPAAPTATAAAGCAIAEAAGGTAEQYSATPPHTDQSRSSTTAPFNNVNDYHGLTDTTGSASGTVATAMPAGYSASIDVSNDAGFGVTASLLPGTEVLRIKVTVKHGSEEIVLEGYRTRHSPNMLP